MYSLVLIAKKPSDALFLHMINEDEEVLLDTLYEHFNEFYQGLTKFQTDNLDKAFALATDFDEAGFGKQAVINIGWDRYELSIIRQIPQEVSHES
jgi:hypothetical protein